MAAPAALTDRSEAGRDFRLLEEQPIYASVSGFDGFYLALMERLP